MDNGMEKLTVTMAARFTETEREEILAMAEEFDEGEIRAVRSGISEQMRMFFLYVRSRIARGTLQWTRDALQELLSEPCEHDLQRAFKFGPQRVHAIAAREGGRLVGDDEEIPQKVASGHRSLLRLSLTQPRTGWLVRKDAGRMATVPYVPPFSPTVRFSFATLYAVGGRA